MRSRRLNGLLHNVLGSFTSRYSDYRGYWLMGFLTAEPYLDIDLLAQPQTGATPTAVAECLAVNIFTVQLRKAQISRELFGSARLRSRATSDWAECEIGGDARRGREFTFEAHVTTKDGSSAISARRVFVAPHNPAFERQSASGRTRRDCDVRC